MFKYKKEKDKKLSSKRYVENIGPHLRNMIDDLKKSGEWKMHLTIKPKFISSTNSKEKRTIYS